MAKQRGCHKSAYEFQDFIYSDMADMVARGYWVVLPYNSVRHLPNLRISPIGCVPQRERRPRIIVDYTYSGVNATTDRRSHSEAMQFGGTLKRLLQKIYAAKPRYGPVYLLKIDLSDGFYRVPLCPAHVPRLGVILPPPTPSADDLIAFPLTLPMGWTESPAQFTSFTETVADLANQLMTTVAWDPPPHPLEGLASTAPPPDDATHPVITLPIPPQAQHPAPRLSNQSLLDLVPRNQPSSIFVKHNPGPLAYTDVYLDDEVLAAQGSRPRLNRLRRTLLHCNDLVFRPNDDHPTDANRREPISTKKLRKGDACWSTRKTVLGWIIDTVQKTLSLPAHRRQTLLDTIDSMLTSTSVPIRDWQRLLGQMRSMVLGIPGGRGLFSQLQVALADAHDTGIVHLNQPVLDQLSDIRVLASDLAARPTRIAEVVQQNPAYVGTCDASLVGMGGVWLPPTCPSARHPPHPPIVWQVPIPAALLPHLQTPTNPHGHITINDLEMAASILHADTLATTCDIRETTLATGSDNTCAVAWNHRGSVTTTGPAAYLLRLNSLHQRRHRYQHIVTYLPGDQNHLADDASRFVTYSHTALLSHFNRTYPQNEPW